MSVHSGESGEPASAATGSGSPDTNPPDTALRVLRRLLWLAIAVFAAGFFAFVARGAEEPPDPFLAPVPSESAVSGFEEVAIRIQAADRPARDLCVLLADDTDSRAEGYRGKSDLPGYSGILFAYPEPVEVNFTMRGVPIPLSIAFFDTAGAFNGALGMDPCPQDGDCPSYEPPAPFRYALEVPEGNLPLMGVGAGSTLTVGGQCPAAT